MNKEQLKTRHILNGAFVPSAVLMFSFFLFGTIIAATVFPNCRTAIDSEIKDLFYISSDRLYEDFWKCGFVNMLMCLCGYYICVYIFGFFSPGVFGIPLIASYRGFSLMSSVYMLYTYAGVKGIFTALAAIGMQSLVTVPCFFVMASHSFDASMSLLRYSVGKPDGETHNFLLKNTVLLLICIAVTLIPTTINMIAVPQILKMIICR